MLYILRLGTLFAVSVLVALVVACATESATPNPTRAPSPHSPAPAATPMVTPATQAETIPTHVPRQHSGEQIQGLGEPLDAPHFVDSFPNHAQTLAQLPERIGINFDLPLTAESTLGVEHDGRILNVGAVEFDPRKIYMSAPLAESAGDGLYFVHYRACFAPQECSDGHIGFRVDSARTQNFLDLTSEKNVTIHLRDVSYQPNQIIITRGTTVTWANDDLFEHFVNSDPHPSHNAHPKLNSLDIPPTGKFSFTFDELGEYTFHCSAHVPQNMFGTILVREAGPVAVPPTNIPATSVANAQPTRHPTVLPPTAAPTDISPPRVTTPTDLPTPHKVDPATLPQERFAAHFVSSSPAHADWLERVPEKIELHFNFTLARNSNINVRKDGAKLALGDLEFSENRLEMTVNLPDAGAGTYHVLYRACWPDKSCHDGEFAFVVAP